MVIQVDSTGIDALKYAGNIVNDNDFIEAEIKLKINFGDKFDKAKFNFIWDYIKKDRWSKYQFLEALDRVLKTKAFPDLRLSDFYETNIKAYPYQWYLEQKRKGVTEDEIETYTHPDIKGAVYKLRDGITLPPPYVKKGSDDEPAPEPKPKSGSVMQGTGLVRDMKPEEKKQFEEELHDLYRELCIWRKGDKNWEDAKKGAKNE